MAMVETPHPPITTPTHCDCLIIGGGIVGLATAWRLLEKIPHLRITVMEKESDWAMHQTGRNSGVIHSGIYYTPGSLKAKLARTGCESTQAFCRQHSVAMDPIGKLIVALTHGEEKRLQALFKRGEENQLPNLAWLSGDALRNKEPNLSLKAKAAIWVPQTAIVDYRGLCTTLVKLLEAKGVELKLNCEVQRLTVQETIFNESHMRSIWHVESSQDNMNVGWIINCAGLQSDRVTEMAGQTPPGRVIPFRGEYWHVDITPETRVKHLIYPTPNPKFPFLGVHLTPTIDGYLHAGPNAVLSLHREGYQSNDWNLKDMTDTLTYGGFLRFGMKHWQFAVAEYWRSLNTGVFLKSLQRMVPAIRQKHLLRAPAGNRAQVIQADGSFVDDFALVDGPSILHVCNAPSPAATAALEIGGEIVQHLQERPGFQHLVDEAWEVHHNTKVTQSRRH